MTDTTTTPAAKPARKPARKAAKPATKPAAVKAPAVDPSRNLQGAFGLKAGKAFLSTASNPKAPFAQLTGSLVALMTALGQANVKALAHVGAKRYGASPVIVIAKDKWRMTKYGADRYALGLTAARGK